LCLDYDRTKYGTVQRSLVLGSAFLRLWDVPSFIGPAFLGL